MSPGDKFAETRARMDAINSALQEGKQTNRVPPWAVRLEYHAGSHSLAPMELPSVRIDTHIVQDHDRIVVWVSEVMRPLVNHYRLPMPTTDDEIMQRELEWHELLLAGIENRLPTWMPKVEP